MSPFIAIISFLVVAVVFQLFTDYRRARLVSRFKYTPVAEEGGLSVVVELDRSPRNLVPLLSHLSSLEGTVDVIVIVKRKAGRTAVRRVRELRSSFPTLSIRTVPYRQGLTERTIAMRHARQPLIMWMKTDERLEGDFVRLAQRHFDNPDVQAVTVNEYVPVGATLAQAGQAWRNIRLNVLSLITKRSTPRAIIYRRRDLYRQSSIHTDATWLLRMSKVKPTSFNGLPYALVSGLLLLPLAVVANNVMGVIIWTIAGVLACIQISWIFAAPAYRLRDRIMLLLLLPFSLVR